MGLARTGAVDAMALPLALAAAVAMQLLTNLQNDVGFTLRGGEREAGRTGWPRATAEGWLGIGAVRTAIVLLALASATLGLLLAWWYGWPVLAIGGASLVAALAYMGGPRPIAYTPFGEATVFVFFGVVATLGSEWLVVGSAGPAGLVASMAVGALAAAALAANNHRDRAHDARIGRRTFAVVFGPVAAIRLYVALVAAAFVLVPVLAAVERHAALLLPLALAPRAWRLVRDFRTSPGGAALNAVVARTFGLEFAFALLLAAAAVLVAVLR
jgi:1,4-dihydroxy-2-naphthoate octaprenyltransferase